MRLIITQNNSIRTLMKIFCYCFTQDHNECTMYCVNRNDFKRIAEK